MKTIFAFWEEKKPQYKTRILVEWRRISELRLHILKAIKAQAVVLPPRPSAHD